MGIDNIEGINIKAMERRKRTQMPFQYPSMLFKEALSKKAFVDYSNLRKLIKLGYIPLPEQPDRESYALDDNLDGIHRLDYLEDMKQYR
jgi:hypothetical protein